jgi:hypothetical protein
MPYAISNRRSSNESLVLANVIINQAGSNRPVTLVGYSLGARGIYSCLMSFDTRKSFGMVDDPVLMGAPVPRAKQ